MKHRYSRQHRRILRRARWQRVVHLRSHWANHRPMRLTEGSLPPKWLLRPRTLLRASCSRLTPAGPGVGPENHAASGRATRLAHYRGMCLNREPDMRLSSRRQRTCAAGCRCITPCQGPYRSDAGRKTRPASHHGPCACMPRCHLPTGRHQVSSWQAPARQLR